MSRLQLPLKRRYLVRFDPKRVPHLFADVLIIGGGIAGIRAALAVDPRLTTIVVTKDALDQSNSAYAQGGIAGVLDPLDDVANHASDTIAAGKGLCDETVVHMVVNEAPERIRELASFGAKFDLKDGEIALTQEGGHSHRRIAHALGDATGKEVMRAMIARIRSAEHAQVWEQTATLDLLTHEGLCRGAIVWNAQHGKTLVWAKQTILCTGGAGRLYRETTNPDIATADGHALGFRAGAELRDMEFMQFHPTVLYIAGSSRHLISEAVRGEGAYLRDCFGHRFMGDYHASLELAPRDEVSLAITRQMDRGQAMVADVESLSESARDAMAQVVDASRSAATWAKRIAEVSRTQEDAVGEVRERMTRIAEISRRNREGAASVAETAQSQARSLHEVEGATRELRELATYLGELARRLTRLGQAPD